MSRYDNKCRDLLKFFSFIYHDIRCNPGWYDLLFEMCRKISLITESRIIPKGFAITTMKEKFGELRVYIIGGNDEIKKLIQEAVELSRKTCEFCGTRKGVKFQEKINRWLVTACDSCLEKQREQKRKQEIDRSDGSVPPVQHSDKSSDS